MEVWGSVVPFWSGSGIGGAFCSSHLRCTIAFLSRSWKFFSPPPRKESLMQGGSLVLGSIASLFRIGPGDSGREGSLPRTRCALE